MPQDAPMTIEEVRTAINSYVERCLRRDSTKFKWNAEITSFAQELKTLSTDPIDPDQLNSWISRFSAHCRAQRLKGFEELDWLAELLIEHQKNQNANNGHEGTSDPGRQTD